MSDIIRSSKFSSFLSNINIVVILIGYPFVVSVFVPFLGDIQGVTRSLTIPFRVISLLISLLTILSCINLKLNTSFVTRVFFVFWIMVLLRIFYDLEIRTDFNVPFEFKSQVFIFAILICFLPMISIYLSYKNIDFNICLKYLFIGCVIILFFSLTTTIANSSSDTRIDGNVAFDSISFAQISLTTSLLSIYKLFQNKYSSIFLIFTHLVIIFLGLFVGLKSGSRGPLLAFFLTIVLWYVFNENSKIIALIKFLLIILVLVFLNNAIIQIIGLISPVTAFRIIEASDGDDMSVIARQESYFWFFENILKNPFFGSQFARLSNTEYPGYAHNIFLDILLGFGITGLIIFLYIIINAFIKLRKSIMYNSPFWIGLIMIQTFILSLTSGSYYSDPVLNCSILLTLMGKFYLDKKSIEKKVK